MNDPTATGTLTREQVLDQLEELARIEHALIVEYLSVSCALGYNLEAVDGGATSSQGKKAASTASSLAQSEMFHLKDICQALVAAGRFPDLGRASSITDASGGQVPIDPPTVEQLRDLVKREKTITAAVDAAYERLAANLTPDLFDEDLLATLRRAMASPGTHAAGAEKIKEALGDPAPADFLRVPRRDTNDEFEKGLLRASDFCYRMVILALRDQFANPEVFGLRSLSTTAMDALDANNRALAQRGLLPNFNP